VTPRIESGTEEAVAPVAAEGTRLRITKLVVHRVSAPLEAPYRWSAGTYPGVSKGIVEVHTDEGIVGLGELPDAELADLVERKLAQDLVGADPLNVEECFRCAVPELIALRNTHGFEPLRAFGGIEIALWDIKGKALGVPLHVLLGGAARTDVAFTEYFAFRDAGLVQGESTPLEVARYCARMREEHGSTSFEGKVGVKDLSTELDMVRQVRSAIGDDAMLRLDANMGWSPATARRALRALEPYGIANVEEPVGDLRALAKLRRHSPIPFSSHDPDVRLAAELGVPDAIVLNLASLGGIRETVKLIAACEAFGIGFWFYSGDTGIGTAAYLQVSAALPYLEQPHQSLLRWYVDDVIAEGPFRPKNGVVPVPEGPGLGVTLDPAALARCKERFEREGALRQFGNGERVRYSRLPRQ